MYPNQSTFEIDQKIKTLQDSIAYENQIKNDLLNLRKNTQGVPGYDYGPEIVEQDKRIRNLENQIQQLQNQRNGYGNGYQQPQYNQPQYNQPQYQQQPQYHQQPQYQQQPQYNNYNAPQQNRLQPQMSAPPRSRSRIGNDPTSPRVYPNNGYSQAPPQPPRQQSAPVYGSNNGMRASTQPQGYRQPPPPIPQRQTMQSQNYQGSPQNRATVYQSNYSQGYAQPIQSNYSQGYAQPIQNNYSQGYAQPVQNNYSQGYNQPVQNNYQQGSYAQPPPPSGNYQQGSYSQPAQNGNYNAPMQSPSYGPRTQASQPSQQPPAIPSRSAASGVSVHVPPRTAVPPAQSQTQSSSVNSQAPSPGPKNNYDDRDRRRDDDYYDDRDRRRDDSRDRRRDDDYYDDRDRRRDDSRDRRREDDYYNDRDRRRDGSRDRKRDDDYYDDRDRRRDDNYYDDRDRKRDDRDKRRDDDYYDDRSRRRDDDYYDDRDKKHDDRDKKYDDDYYDDHDKKHDDRDKKYDDDYYDDHDKKYDDDKSKSSKSQSKEDIRNKHSSIYSDDAGSTHDDNLELYLDIYGTDNKDDEYSGNSEPTSAAKEKGSNKKLELKVINDTSNSPRTPTSTHLEPGRSPISPSRNEPYSPSAKPVKSTNNYSASSPNLGVHGSNNSVQGSPNIKSPKMTSVNNLRAPSSPNISSPPPGVVIPPRVKVPPPSKVGEKTVSINPPPRSPVPVSISNDQPVIPARTASTSTNLNALDFITAPTELDDSAIEHRIKKIQTKLEIEKKYKIGSEKAIDVIKMSGAQRNSPQYNEAQMRLKESNEKIDCLNRAKQNYEKIYKGQPIEKDLTEYPEEPEDISAPQHHTLVKTLGRIRNAQNEGKLQMKFICIQKVQSELSALINVNGRIAAQTSVSKGFQWNYEVDIMATKDAEVEIVFQDDKKEIVGLIWFKSSDLEEATKLKYAESGKHDDTFALQVEPVGELIIQLSYMRANGNYLTLRPGIQRRKAANRMLIYQLGHKLAKLQNYNILKCAMCGEFILSNSGLQCAECNYACHQSCVPTITSKCISQSNSEMEEKKNDPLTLFVSKYNIPHRFKLSNNLSASWCSHCGQMLPVGKQCILKCSECNMVCHHGCKIYIQNLCGLSMDMVKSFTTAIEKTEREKKRNQVAELQRHHKTLIRKPPPTQKKREVTINDFHFMVVLGRGNFGKVMLAEEKSSKRLYAIKVLKKQAIIEDDEVQSMMNEKSAFLAASQINHPFLVNLHSCFSTTTRIYFVMEYCQCGDLISHIGKKNFNKARAKYYLSEVLLALEFLHSRDIIYRDLKLDNILLTVEGHIKLTDFGLCKGNMSWNTTTKTFCGTTEFIAPEILIGSPYTRAVDWWTFGVLIYEMIVKEAPFSGEDDEEIFENIINTQPRYPSSMGKDCMAVVRGLLKKNPTQRLGYSVKDAEEIKSQAFFNDVDWQAMLEKRIPPPYVPTLKSKVDVSLFDEEFTKEPPVLTPVQCFLDPFEQELFDGFAYVNPYLVEN